MQSLKPGRTWADLRAQGRAPVWVSGDQMCLCQVTETFIVCISSLRVHACEAVAETDFCSTSGAEFADFTPGKPEMRC